MSRNEQQSRRKERDGAASPLMTRSREASGFSVVDQLHYWKLEEAKARFSEVVRRARDEGPQYVTLRGKPAVAIIEIGELERLLPQKKPRLGLVDFLESLDTGELPLERDPDLGRDVDL